MAPTRPESVQTPLRRAADRPEPDEAPLEEFAAPKAIPTRRRGWIIRRALVAADVVGLLLGFVLAQSLYQGLGPESGRFSPGAEYLLFILCIPGWLILADVYGLYARDESRADHSTVDETFMVFNMLTVGTFGFFALAHLFPGLTEVAFSKVILFWAISICSVCLARSVARHICRTTSAYVQNTLIIGAGHVGQQVARKLRNHPEYGVNVVGFVDQGSRDWGESLGEVGVIGTTGDLPRIVREQDVERVIVAFSQHPHYKTLGMIRELNALDVQVDLVPRLYEVLGPHTTVHSAEGLPLVGIAPARLGRWALIVKRSMDIVAAVAGLAVLAPVFLIVSIAIKLDSRGPVFFRQERVGRGNQRFSMIKFRTMTRDAEERKQEVAHLNKHLDGDARMFKIHDDPRVTKVGRFLRSRWLDELPQLVNVLRGQMSLVGPRPLIPSEHDHVDGWAMRRLDLKPGMTGVWQVLGAGEIPFGEMVGLDYQYVTAWSIGLDVKLLLKTVGSVGARGRRGA